MIGDESAGSDGHDVVAGVDEQDLPGDPAGHLAAQEQRRVIVAGQAMFRRQVFRMLVVSQMLARTTRASRMIHLPCDPRSAMHPSRLHPRDSSSERFGWVPSSMVEAAGSRMRSMGTRTRGWNSLSLNRWADPGGLSSESVM